MATLTLTRAQLRTKMRQLLGATDVNSGGPIDTDFDQAVNEGLTRFAVRAGALESVHKLSTKAFDKYLPLIDEILWPKTISFVDSDGTSFPLGMVDYAPRPGSLGTRPTVWWLTAVNVPDIAGPSTRTIGIDPYVNYDGAANVLIESIQLPQTLTGDANVPEIHGAIQPYIAYFGALELVSSFPEKLAEVPMWEARCREGIELFIELSRGDREQAKTNHDAMGYRRGYRTKM